MKPMTQDTIVTQFDRNRLRGMVSVFRKRSAVNPKNLDALEMGLSDAQTVAPEAVPSDVVTMNSQVILLNLITRERLTLTLVFPDAMAHASQRVSVLSLLGLTLLGCRVGDVLEHCESYGFQPLLVERIAFQPEATGNYFV